MPADYKRSAPDTLAGTHTINGRQWRTACEPYSRTERCRTDIWATVVQRAGASFTVQQGWAFNNLTYLPFMTRASWKGNPLGSTGRSYTMTTVHKATARPAGGYTFSQSNQWLFNNIVMFQGG